MERITIKSTPRQVDEDGPLDRLAPTGVHAAISDIDSRILIPPVPYIDAVRRLLGNIDFDPCSSSRAQRFIDATTWYQADDAAASLAESWNGRVFLSLHPNTKIARSQIQKLLRDYLTGRVSAACLLMRDLERFRVEPLLLGFPFVIHYKRMQYFRWDKKKEAYVKLCAPFPSITVYLPLRRGAHLDEAALSAFVDNFRGFGRPMLSEPICEDWEQDAIVETATFRPKCLLTKRAVDRYSDAPSAMASTPFTDPADCGE